MTLFTVLMSLCDSDTKIQVESIYEYKELEKKLDSMGLFKLIKELRYTGDDLYTRNNKAMAHIKSMDLHQDRFQSVQDFRDHYLAIKGML